jgi:serine/threonine protein kinase
MSLLTEEEIFNAALHKPAAERAAFLDRACQGDTLLRAAVEALVAAHDVPDSFLEAPLGDATIEQPTERLGTQIGPYKLLQQIGEGGFGVVYMAEQLEPVRRKVALKVIKPGMDTRQVIARFEAERQALAVMDHPNIAHVLDAGTTESGRPYFVMDLVRGIPITQYCDENQLPIRERLELFATVCQATQHAHTKGIIHRDIKPTNVLVTRQDGQSVVKVIDFGVAKAMGQQLTEKTLFTEFAQMIGTPLYMSPEQAELSSVDIDTRSDIYSLGVLLYELLTGTTPVSKEQLKQAAFDEIRRIIREDDPPKPSTRISTAESAPSIAAQRHTEPAKLARLVRGELDWIVMKALEKDRSRRYETANSFAMDVQRYLGDEPVQACPPSIGYRLRKLVRRNKGPVLAVSVVILALFGGVVGTTWGLIRAEEQRVVVERQRDELVERNRALQAAHERERLLNERARQAIETVASDTAIDELTRERELRPEQKDFLDKMIQYYAESTAEGAATEQEWSRQAQAYHRMGRLNHILGRSQASESAYRRAIALGQKLTADFPNRPEFRQQLALSHNALGVLLSADRTTEKESAYAEALAILKPLAAEFPNRPEFRQILAGVHNNLGNLFHETGRTKEAEDAHAEALAIREQLAADSSAGPNIRRAVAMSHNNLGWLFQTTERLPEAEAAFRKAVASQKQVVADFPDRPDFRQDLTKCQINLGNLLRDSGRLKEAEAVYGEALPIQKQLAAEFPNRPEFRHELAGGHNSLGILLRDKGRLKEAEAAYAEALAIYKQLVADFPRVPEYYNDTAVTLWHLAYAAGRRRDFAAARQRVNEAFPYHQAALQANPRHPDYRQYYRDNLVELTRSCAGQGDRPAALAAATKRRDLGWDRAADAYDAACLLAQCVPIVENDDKLDAAKRQAEMLFYADQAMAMLEGAVAKNYKNIEHMKKDKNLDPLREREDFKKLLSELDGKKNE